jgi:hypothetical protein
MNFFTEDFSIRDLIKIGKITAVSVVGSVVITFLLHVLTPEQ